jgi:hypothetical protein
MFGVILGIVAIGAAVIGNLWGLQDFIRKSWRKRSWGK